jgi:hypothetical protein
LDGFWKEYELQKPVSKELEILWWVEPKGRVSPEVLTSKSMSEKILRHTCSDGNNTDVPESKIKKGAGFDGLPIGFTAF